MAGPARGGCLVFCRMLPESRSYDALVREFRWPKPAQFNIGVEVCDRWAERDPGKLALIAVGADGRARDVSYGWLRETSNRLANALAANGVKRGDRVAILLPQAPEVAAIHIAVYKLGAIALPLAVLFGTDAIAYRLQNAGARAVITNTQGLAKLAEIRRTQGDALAGLTLVLSIDGPADGALGFQDTLSRASSGFSPVPTAADDPAMMIYTSGTTGQPKGALHAHRVLIGHMPGIELPHEFFPQPGDRFWTPADWAWAGGLLDCLLPSLYCGVPVVAQALRQVRSGGGLRRDGAPSGAQCVHSADRASHAARGAEPARPPRHRAALGRLRRRGARRRDVRMGQGRARRRDQRVLRPDRMQSRGRRVRRHRRGAARRHRQGDPRPHRRGDRRRTAASASPANSARSR